MSAKGTLLVVEDNADHLELFMDAFTPEYEVITASEGEECLKIIGERHCDLVILDYYLSSHFSGLDILRRITESAPGLPVVMVTAYGNEDLAVQAMKFGAKDYIRKTLDNSYIDRIHRHVLEILEAKGAEEAPSVRQDVLDFFEERRDEFVQRWLTSMHDLRRRVDLPESFVINEDEMGRFFSAFLADIQNDRATETLIFLKRMVLLQDAEEKSLLTAELLNMSFKEVARDVLREHYPDSFDSRSSLMAHIGRIVDENDLELSKEYENLIWQASQRARQSERMATKSVLLTTLQHEVRQPLAYLLNTAELLQANRAMVTDEALREFVVQARRIEALLDRLERDSHMLTKKYSEDLKVLDLPDNSAGGMDERGNSSAGGSSEGGNSASGGPGAADKGGT